MSKRVQVTLSDDEYEALRELSEIRGESMSLILGAEVAAQQLLWQWRKEIKVRKSSELRLAALEVARDKQLAKLKPRGV